MKIAEKFYSKEKFEAFERDNEILIFKRTLFGNLKWIVSYNKGFFTIEKDELEKSFVIYRIKKSRSKRR